MKIKIKEQCVVAPGVVGYVNDVVDLPDADAKVLVAMGRAEATKEPVGSAAAAGKSAKKSDAA